MASYHSLGEELECPICKQYLKDPKVMGKCLHAACLDCVRQLAACSTSFKCPVCRETCEVPPNGVIGLKDDFKLRSFVEKYQKMKVNESLIQCTNCPNPACHLCEECDNIYMCRDCSRKHSGNPLTAAHAVFGLCSRPKHGRKLAKYCRKCGTAICYACLIHHPSNTERHDVVNYQEVVGDKVAEVATAVSKLDGVRERKENALTNIKILQKDMVETINSDSVELGQQSESAIDHLQKKKVDFMTKKHMIEKQIDQLNEQIEIMLKQKTEVEKERLRTREKETTLLQQKEKDSEYLTQYRERCIKKFKDVKTQAVAETDEIKAEIDKGRKEISLKPILDDQTVPRLLRVKEKLTRAITIAERVDKVASFVDACKADMVRFLPNREPMVIGRLIGHDQFHHTEDGNFSTV